MENTKYGKRREGRWTPIQAKAQDTRADPNSWETHLVRKRWDIGLLRALSLRIMMMMMMMMNVPSKLCVCVTYNFGTESNAISKSKGGQIYFQFRTHRLVETSCYR